MRRLLSGCLVALVAAIAPGLALADEAPVTRHLHLLTTPNGDAHPIAGGLTFQAPCTAFLNFHEIVHETVFGTTATGAEKNPNGPLGAQLQPQLGTCTPDS